jgi:hypothetical protein
MKHYLTKRIGEPGVDLWQCQYPDCQAKGPIGELMQGECTRPEPLTEDEIGSVLIACILMLEDGESISIVNKDGSVSIYGDDSGKIKDKQ